jgi:hypothetical protein
MASTGISGASAATVPVCGSLVVFFPGVATGRNQSMPTTDPQPSNEPATTDDPSLEQCRQLLALLATDREGLRALTEDLGEDVLPYALQVLAIELVRTSIKVDELEETIEEMRIGLRATGALTSGLLGMSKPKPTDDPEDDRIWLSLHRHGADIRHGAGLADLAPAQ